LLSVSTPTPPAVAVMASQMVSTVEQMIVTVAKDVSNLEQALTQEFAQEAAYVGVELDHLLGINPTPPNPSLGTAAPQPGSGSGMGRGNSVGSGSGSSATATAHNAPNQPLPNSTQPTGSGSGSGSSTLTTVHGNASTQGVSKVPPLSSGSGSGSGTPMVYFGSGSYTVSESGSGSGSCPSPSVTLPVDLTAPSNQPVSVSYSTSDGSATAGTDYTAQSSTVTFPIGQIVQYITIPILDDGTDESVGSEWFQVNLSNPSGATLGTPSSTVVYITEGPQQGASDTLIWNPMCGSTDASDRNHSRGEVAK
jgi:hypothetical protein